MEKEKDVIFLIKHVNHQLNLENFVILKDKIHVLMHMMDMDNVIKKISVMIAHMFNLIQMVIVMTNL